MLSTIKIAAIGVTSIIIIGAGIYIQSIRTELATTKSQVVVLQQSLKQTQDNLKAVTVKKEEVEQNLRTATELRQKIQSNLNAALRKLNQQKPPTECSAAIDWSIQNKNDLNWEQ